MSKKLQKSLVFIQNGAIYGVLFLNEINSKKGRNTYATNIKYYLVYILQYNHPNAA